MLAVKILLTAASFVSIKWAHIRTNVSQTVQKYPRLIWCRSFEGIPLSQYFVEFRNVFKELKVTRG